MAWVTEYDLRWTNSNTSGITGGTIYIQRDGGSYQQSLSLLKGSLEIRQVLPSWESQIFRMSCSFAIVNDFSDYYALLPLMTISNGQLKVVVESGLDSDAEIIFEGYLNPETISQDFFNYAPLRLTASGLIKKLEYTHPTEIDTIQFMSLIDIIDDCLLLSGSSYNIRVNNTLAEQTAGRGVSQTVFNRTGVFTQLFWENNIDRLSALDIIEEILKTFNCYLYWYKENWYIEAYEDLDHETGSPCKVGEKGYVQYTSGTSAGYGYSDTAGIECEALIINQIHDPQNRPQKHPKQLLSILPGMRQIDVRLNQLQYFNLLNPDLSDPVVNGVEADRWFPPFRTWHAYDVDPGYAWTKRGETWKNIANSITRAGGYDITSGDGGTNGLTTRFRITSQLDTELTIRFKFAVPYNYGAPDPNFFDNPEDTEITFHWWARIGLASYIVHNESAGTWETSLFMPDNQIVISGADLDQDRWVYEGEIVMPVGELLTDLIGSSLASGYDADIAFRMGTETYTDNGGSALYTDEPGQFAVFGDFAAAITENPGNNLLQGTQNTDFLDKKEIELLLYDADSWSYRNSLLYGDDWDSLCEAWGRDSVFGTLGRNLLQSKFRLHNVARQKISIDYHTTEIFKPLQIWEENKQADKQFALTQDIYYPENQTHSVVLSEYDDTTVVNLI